MPFCIYFYTSVSGLFFGLIFLKWTLIKKTKTQIKCLEMCRVCTGMHPGSSCHPSSMMTPEKEDALCPSAVFEGVSIAFIHKDTELKMAQFPGTST